MTFAGNAPQIINLHYLADVIDNGSISSSQPIASGDTIAAGEILCMDRVSGSSAISSEPNHSGLVTHIGNTAAGQVLFKMPDCDLVITGTTSGANDR